MDVGQPCSVYRVQTEDVLSVKDSLPPVSDVLQLMKVSPIFLYTVHYKNNINIPITLSLQKSVPPPRHAFCWWILQLLAEGPVFTPKL
jgi:hypothetical protein